MNTRLSQFDKIIIVISTWWWFSHMKSLPEKDHQIIEIRTDFRTSSAESLLRLSIILEWATNHFGRLLGQHIAEIQFRTGFHRLFLREKEKTFLFVVSKKNPILLTRKALDKMKKNFVVIEIWDKKVSGPRDEIIGIVKVPLEQFYISFKDKEISRVLLRAQYPVISGDGWFRIVDPFSAKEKSFGELEVFLAMGSSDQITAVRMTKTGVQKIVRAPEIVESQIESNSSLIEHHFDVMIESINGLRAFESMIWGESDCFIQYSFPNQENSKEKQTSSNVKEKFQLQTVRTGATLCTSDPTFHDSHKFRYVLSAADALHKYFYAGRFFSNRFENFLFLDGNFPF